jgi:hypothetical protein
MKRLIVAIVALVAVCGVVMADETGVYFKFKNIAFTYPLAHVSFTPAMLDWKTAQEFAGAETALVTWPAQDMGKIPANVLDIDFGGAVTPFEPHAIPYGGFNVQIGKLFNAPGFLSYIGLWAGHDFNYEDSRIITNFGIKASQKIW